MTVSIRWIARLAALGAAVAVAGCGSTSGLVPKGYYTATPAPGSNASASTSSSPAPGASPSSAFLQADPSTRTVTLRLVAALTGADGGFNFDGYGKGQMRVIVPQGWRVTVDCSDHGALPHSCAIVEDASSTTPAFPGASIPDPTTGLTKGQSATFTFAASRAGSYRIACLVPGHEDAGMWDVLEVVPAGSAGLTTS